MPEPRGRLVRGLTSLLVSASLALLVTFAPDATPTVHAAEDFLRLGADASYRVDPDAHVVRVRIDFRATNLRPNATRRTPGGTVVTRYFFDRLLFAIPTEARSLRAVSGGSNLNTSTRKRTGFSEVTVRFPNLFYRASRSIRVDFTLPSGKPRSSSEVRVGAAFATFTAWAWGDAGRSTVKVILPTGFDDAGYGDDITQRTHPDRIELTASAINRPDTWYRVIAAERSSALTEHRIEAGGRPVVVRAWPEDSAWRDRVADVLEDGLPALETMIGLPWPVTGDLTVNEVHGSLLHGYAGSYDASSDAITMSEDLDDNTILHEASHAWFNGALVADRWIDEGLADYYADEVRQQLGLPDEFSPVETERSATGAFPLNDWPNPERIEDDETQAQERYGYDASYTVIKRIADEIGIAGMRAVLVAADGEQNPYRGDGAADRSGRSEDWRWFLDLLEEAGESETADDLFRTWVVSTGDVAQLRTREAARAAYDELDTAGQTWAMPRGIRSNMNLWRFDDATALIEAAAPVIELRDDLIAATDDLELTPPSDLETPFEAALRPDDLAEIGTTLEGRIAAASALDGARDALSVERTPLVALGLTGETPDTGYVAARSAFEAGDVTAASAASAVTVSLLAGAESAGTTRALLIGLVLLGLLVLAGVAIALRRRSRRRLASAAIPNASSTLAATPDHGFARPEVPSAPDETAPGAEPD